AGDSPAPLRAEDSLAACAKIRSCLIGLLFCLSAVVTGCNPPNVHPAAPAEPVLEVKTVHPHRPAISPYLKLPGEVHRYLPVTLLAKVDGYLQTLTVDKGVSVKAGDLIADIEVPELKAKRVKYQAELELAEAEFKQISAAPSGAPAAGANEL